MTRSKKRFFILICIVIVGLFVAVGLNWDALVIEYKLWRDFKSLGLNEQGSPEYEHFKSGIVMVLLPGGDFMMGSPEDEPYRNEDEHLQKVRLSPFLIAKYEVSQAIWEKVMESNPSRFKGKKVPIHNVDWTECYGDDASFCKKVGLKLPTEAQWEYACRAGTKTPFYTGERLPGTHAGYGGWKVGRRGKDGNPDASIVEVDSFRSNPFGLYSMHGNVWEWCLDSYDLHYKDKNSVRNGDVAVRLNNNLKVLRGGSWFYDPDFLRSAKRRYLSLKGSVRGFNDVGFRPVYLFSSSL